MFRKKSPSTSSNEESDKSSSDSSEDSSSAKSSSDDSTSGEDTSSSSSSDDGSKKKSKKKSRISMWDYIEDTWPVSQRPNRMKKKKFVNKMSMKEVEALFNMHCSREKSLHGQKVFQAVAVETHHPTVKFSEGKDNCKNKLHKARFLRQPLTSPEKWFKKVPLKRSPVIRELPLEFTGSHDQVAERTIEIMHDRSKACTLKEFYSKNLEVKGAKDFVSGEMQGDAGWVNFESLQGIQEALVNYQAVSHYMWPNDPTPTSLWRILITYNWASSLRNPKLQEKIICEYFKKVTKKNAGRAVRRDAPYDYVKHEEVFRRVCRDHKVNPDDILFGVVHQTAGQKKAQQPQAKAQKAQGGAGKGAGGKGGASKAADKRAWPTFEGHGVCFGFNAVEEAKKCTNAAHERGCKGKDKKGADKIYAHVCSNWLEGKGYCLGSHMKKDCKGDK